MNDCNIYVKASSVEFSLIKFEGNFGQADSI